MKKDKAYFDYWANTIVACQKRVREDENPFASIEETLWKSKILEDLVYVLKKHSSKNSTLLCKGAVMGLRPFQIANQCSFLSRIYVQDQWGSWGHEKPTSHLEKFTNHPLLKHSQKMVALSYYDDLSSLFKRDRRNLFLDLSYRRHTLPKDLEDLYPKLQKQALFCGNMGGDPYVREILNRFSRAHNLSIDFRGDIWFFSKQ